MSYTFTLDTVLKELYTSSTFAPQMGDLFFGGDQRRTEKMDNRTIRDVITEQPTFFFDDLKFGVDRLAEIAESGIQYVFPLYPDAEGEKADVKLIYMPAKEKKYDTYAINIAGGAYMSVCSMAESIPISARLNEVGMDCFCLNYRVTDPNHFDAGTLPKPTDDLAAAWKFIKEHEEQFGLKAENYIVGGSSAGGHITVTWGTENHGARHYGIPQAKMLFPEYPLVSMRHMSGRGLEFLGTAMFGAGFTEDSIREYDAAYQMDPEYPPFFVVKAIDDPMVDPGNAADLVAAAEKNRVPYMVISGPTGGHGFGLGSATSQKGWVERMLEFYHNFC